MTNKQETKKFFFSLTDVNFYKLWNGNIPKLDMKSITMYQTFDRSLSESVRCMREARSDQRKKRHKGDYITSEVEYDVDTLIQYHFDGNMVAPVVWLVQQGIINRNNLPEDLSNMYESLIESMENYDFDFYDIIIRKSDIVSAYKIDLNQLNNYEKII